MRCCAPRAQGRPAYDHTHQGDELTQPLIELAHKKPIERDAVLKQPQKGRPVHQRDTGVAQRHKVVLTHLVFQNGSLTEPSARPDPGKRHGLAGQRQRAQFDEAGDDAGPGVQAIAAVTDVGTLRKRSLDDAASRVFTFALAQVMRPERNAMELFRCNHVCFRDRPARFTRARLWLQEAAGLKPELMYLSRNLAANRLPLRRIAPGLYVCRAILRRTGFHFAGLRSSAIYSAAFRTGVGLDLNCSSRAASSALAAVKCCILTWP